MSHPPIACRVAISVALRHNDGMTQPISAREAAKIARKHFSTIHRDALAGRLPVAQQYPGYNGPRLFDPDVVRSHYGVTESAKKAS